MALGVDGVELDVRVAGNDVVVIHDATVDRTTNGRGLVAEMPLATLRELNAGDGQTIPTLAEVLAALPDDLMVNIELKGPGTAKPVAEVVRDHDVGGNAGIPRMLVSSFDHHELARFHELCPALACAPLASRWSDRLEDTVAALDAWSVNLADRAATEHRITKIGSWQRRCLVYTVNNPERARRLHALGVAGVFTDFPDRFRGIDFAVGQAARRTALARISHQGP